MTSLVDPDDSVDGASQELARLLFARHDERETLQAVAHLAHRMTPGCDALSIAVLNGERFRTSVATNEVARRIDDRQFALGEGPGPDAIRLRASVHVEEYTEETRWPRLRRDIAAQRVESSLTLPLIADDAVIGTLNIYGREPRCFAGGEDAASAFAEQAAVTLANAVAFHRAADLATQLAVAIEHRDVIGQAKGILMASQGITADEAFDRLRRTSQQENRKLYEVARIVVAGRESLAAQTTPTEPDRPDGPGGHSGHEPQTTTEPG